MNKREIKFRVWDITAHRYIEVYDMDPEGEWVHVAQGDQLYLVNSPLKTEFVLEQFTGLHDKNGKEIYEGDVVIYSGDSDITYSLPGEVSIGPYFTHAQEFHHFGVRVKRIDMNEGYFGLCDGVEDYVVIGNIHENPDLLK